MDVFYALAEPTRRNIVEMLINEGQMTASEIYQRFTSTPSAISQHLKVLRDAQVVRMDKKAQQRVYHVNPAAISDVEAWAEQLRSAWEDRLNTLDKFIVDNK